MSAKGLPLSRFALLLSFVPDVQRIVRDRTGLAGAFDLDIEFAPAGGADAPDLPPITTALKEQLGLELRPATGSVERDRDRLCRAADAATDPTAIARPFAGVRRDVRSQQSIAN